MVQCISQWVFRTAAGRKTQSGKKEELREPSEVFGVVRLPSYLCMWVCVSTCLRVCMGAFVTVCLTVTVCGCLFATFY